MEEFLLHEEYRRDSYKLLSECYYLPDEKLLGILSGLEESQSRLYSEIARNTPGISELESLKIDYSRLFVGPYGLLAPPYGSVYLEDTSRVMGNSTMDVRNNYREEGLDIGHKEAPDHIAIELEFMYFLIYKEIEAIRIFDSTTAASCLNRQKVFLENHLGAWVSAFANNVEASAQTKFYKILARQTKSCVEEDLEGLSDNMVFTALGNLSSSDALKTK